MRTAPHVIYETLHGSRAYGLARPDSDHDYKGVIIGPARWYLGYVGGPEQIEHGPDHVRFEVRKFVRLAAGANPTLLETLYTHPDDHRTVTAIGRRLLDARDAFLSKKVQHSFGGYALSQLKRIRTHRQWLLNPPEAPPTRAEYGLPDKAVVPRDQMGAAEAMRQKGDLAALDLSPNFLDMLDRERRYKQARRRWGQYQTWLKHRNRKRAALEAHHGYDTKHAMHLVRLLTMGGEILRGEGVRVRRDDRDALLAIRDGALGYDALVERAEALSAAIDAAAATSTLPDAPDEERLDTLCAEWVEAALRGDDR